MPKAEQTNWNDLIYAQSLGCSWVGATFKKRRTSEQNSSKGIKRQESLITRAYIKKKSAGYEPRLSNTQSVGKHRCRENTLSGTDESTISWTSINLLRASVVWYWEMNHPVIIGSANFVNIFRVMTGGRRLYPPIFCHRLI